MEIDEKLQCYTVAETAKILKIAEITVTRMIREKRLKAFLIGTNYRIPRIGLLNLFDNKKALSKDGK